MTASFPEDISLEVKDLLESIREGRLAVFCGSGMSINPPSSLPSAQMLMKYIIKKLALKSSDFEIEVSLEEGVIEDNQRMGLDNRAHKLRYPFEAFIETVNKYNPIVFYLWMIYWGSGEPNKNHTLLAELVKKGYLKELMTTNFDTKIEEALEESFDSESGCLKKGVGFKVFSKESEFVNINFSNLEIPIVLKIHGTVDDMESVRATLTAISQMELREARIRITKHFFQEAEHDILILGYSLSDEFDINPILRGLNSKNRIFLIQHTGKDSEDMPRVSPLQDPLKGFKGRIIHCNTDDIIDHVWEKLIEKPWKERKRAENWRQIIDGWSRLLYNSKKSLTAGALLYDLQKYPRVKRLYKHSLDYSRKIGDLSATAECLYYLTALEHERGNYDEAEKLCQQSLDIYRRIKDHRKTAGSLHLLALIQQGKGNHEKAKELYRQSLDSFRHLKDNSGIAILLCQIATIEEEMGNYDEAEKLCQQSLEISEKIGDPPGVAASLHELALIQQGKGNHSESEKLYEQALELFMKVGDLLGTSKSLYNLAVLQNLKNNYDAAEMLYKQSLAIDRKIRNKPGIAKCFSGLGNLSEKWEEFDKASKYYRRALRIFQEIGEKRSAGITKFNLDRVHFRISLAYAKRKP